MQFCRWIESGPEAMSPQDSFRRSYRALPFGPDEDPRVALPARLAETPELEKRVRLVLGALAQGLDPRWVRSKLTAWRIHPVSIVLAESHPKLRADLGASLLPDHDEWTLGNPTIFRGSELPPGVVVPGPFVLEGCSGLTDLPEDLIAESLHIHNCRDLRSLPQLPRGVAGLRIENAPNLVDLPGTLELKKGLQLSACPSLGHLPSDILADEVIISHCPGIRTMTARIECRKFSLESLINLTDLDLDLTVSGDLELNLPSLRTFRGRADVCGRLRISGASLTAVDADITVGDHAVIEHCRSLESISGLLHVNGDLRIQRNPQLTTTPEGFVRGTLELTDLPALGLVDPCLIASCRTVRIRRCANLEKLPYGVNLRGSMELLDLPSLCHWPPSMSVGILTVLGCPGLPDPPPGVIIRTAFRRAGIQERESIALTLTNDSDNDRAPIESMRRIIRTMTVSGVYMADICEMLQAEGHASGDVLVAAAAEGLGLREFLDECAVLADGTDGLAKAAQTCARASIHPGSLALVVKDLTKARWLAELYSESLDLAIGVMGDGNLRILTNSAWDLPEGLAVPGQVRVADTKGPSRWPERFRVLGGFKGCSPEMESSLD